MVKSAATGLTTPYEIDLTADRSLSEKKGARSQNPFGRGESGIGVVLKYPTLHMAVDIRSNRPASQISGRNVITDMVVTCVDVIFDAGRCLPMRVESSHGRDLTAFLNELVTGPVCKNHRVFSALCPKLKKDIEWTVSSSAGKTKLSVLEGMANFFG